jgi:4'-phosphopantetheinyl transferase
LTERDPQLTDQWPLGLPVAESAWCRIGDVWLYRYSLDLDDMQHTAAAEMLSPDERARAARFLREGHGSRFIAGRAGLRTVLGGWMGVLPGEVLFEYGEKGKPRVKTGPFFNLSHSEGVALLAVSTVSEVGVDIEKIDSATDILAIASNWFSAEECSAMRALTHQWEQRDRFFSLWACKEAYLKATGKGITAGLNSCTVHFGQEEDRIVVPSQPGEEQRWRLRRLSVHTGYAAAVCYERSDTSTS